MPLHGFETILGLLLVIAGVALAAEKLRIPYPILLVLTGLGLSVVPGLPHVELKPEYVFVIFLPPLLYYAGAHTTWRDFRANIRPISTLAVGLVLATTFVVAWVAHELIPGMTWPAAIALGAVVSPPDAIAASAVTEHLHVPRRIVTILEGESLVNDATALVAYRFAQAAAVAGSFSWAGASWEFLYLVGGGLLIGYLAGVVSGAARARINEPSVEGTISLLTPYLAYLPCESLGVSGVLATVTAGIYMSRRIPSLHPRARLRTTAVWDTLVFLLNGLLFILIGLQLPSVVVNLSHIHPGLLLLYAGAVCVAAVVIRIVWVFPIAYIPRLLIPALRRRDPLPPASHVFLVSWCGMRGVISLAAALALPMGFPQRDMIIFLAFSVILFTLVMQGLTLPPLILLLNIRGDDAELAEERQARVEATHAALARLQAYTFDEAVKPQTIERIRMRYDERLAALGNHAGANGDGEDASSARDEVIAAQVYREVLVAERNMVTFLRDQNVISDPVLRRLMNEIDLEETRLASALPAIGVTGRR